MSQKSQLSFQVLQSGLKMLCTQIVTLGFEMNMPGRKVTCHSPLPQVMSFNRNVIENYMPGLACVMSMALFISFQSKHLHVQSQQ